MKKPAAPALLAAVLVSLTACSSTAPAGPEMYLQKAILTEEEQSILDLAGSEKVPYILEFAVDGTIQSLQINTYELDGGEWALIAGGGGVAYAEPRGRIALTFDNIGLGLRTAVEHKGSSSYKRDSDFDFEGMSAATSYLTDQTAVEYEKEIPLAIQIHTSKNEISSFLPEVGYDEPETFADLGYEKVYAITCRFSQKTVHELSRIA